MRLLIIRHGDPDYEHDSLTEKGKKEAKLLADYLEKEKIDYFYVSSYGRAKETAAPTLERHHATPVICEYLHEFDYPEDPGKQSFSESWHCYPHSMVNKFRIRS